MYLTHTLQNILTYHLMDKSNQLPPRSMDRMTFQTFKFKSTSSNFALFNYSTLVTKTQVYSLGPLSIIFYYQNIGLYHYGMCHSTSITRTQVYIIRSSFTHPFITRTQVYITMTCVTQPMSLTCNTSLVPMPHGFPTTFGVIVICHHGLC